MDRNGEARKIMKLVASGKFKMAEHTFTRSQERGISRQQIIHCAQNCIYSKWQEDHESHLFIGYIDTEVPGGFSAVLRSGVIIVTIFKRRLTRWEKALVKLKNQ